MAANRIEASPTPDAGATTEVAPPPAGKGGIKALLPLIITIVAMPALAFAMTNYVLLPKLKKELGITAPAAAEGHEAKGGAEDAHKEAVPMTKLLVNVAGTMGGRYLLVSLSVVGAGKDFKEKMEQHDPQLRDMAMGALATKTLNDLEKPGSRNLIRAELISGFNNILGTPTVKEIYMTEFAIQ